MLAGMLALVNSVCFLALSRADRVLISLILAGLIALCCVVLAVNARR